MGSTTKRGYWFPAGNDAVALFPGQNELLFMKKLDTDMDTALTANIAAARIPNLAASKITSGTFAEARIPTIKKEKLDSLVWAQVSEMIQDESGGGFTVTELEDEDLNTITTSGLYTQDETNRPTTALNYPVDGAPIMLLVATSLRRTWQLAQTYDGKLYARESCSSTWRDWTHINGSVGGGDGIGAFVTVPRNEDVTTAETEIKAAKDSNTGLVFLTAKVICSSSFTNGDVIGTLPNGYVTPTGFDKPVFAKPYPPTGAEQTAADTLTFNPNNGEMTLTLDEMPEEGMWLNINTVFSENYIGTTREDN